MTGASILAFMISRLADWRTWVIGAVAGLAVFAFVQNARLHHAKTDLVAARAAAAAARHDAEVERQRASVSAKVSADNAAAQAKVETVTRTLIQKVPAYVTREDDARCPVPAGAVGVLDAAAAGVSTVPEPARRADDAPAPALSGVVASAVTNYGICHANAEQLSALQTWIRLQQAVKP